ncbi:ubiquitin-protein ligase peroxin 12 [Tieghemiomyces parasiticus]|uniref:Peroxisome assembly protein 12 n=1 Tax=Tieghemiomyces parasiticus TaxID=78921 RepID=A0A9W7ZSS0_9FUNG|nr:ubiquitin-protein ligase peroxin 12 [Tieghemiomyces parasiticus]
MEFMSDVLGSGTASRPSLFELFAQEKMASLFKPALVYALSIYAQRYPRYLLRLVNRQDEAFALLMLMVERHYLRKFGSSFTENIYGLKRASTDSARTGRKLSGRDVTKSLVLLVVVPYLKAKLDLLYERHGGGGAAVAFLFSNRGRTPSDNADLAAAPPLAARLRTWIREAFLASYPYLHAAYHLLPLGYSLAYLLGRTRYYSPWLHLMGLEIQRMTHEDYADMQNLALGGFASGDGPLGRDSTPLQRVRHLLAWLTELPLNLLNVILPTSVLFFRFLEWWYASDLYKASKYLPIPPAPAPLKPHPEGFQIPDDPLVCPVCRESRTNPAVLPNSGYACCYPCLHKYVELNRRCPVTWIPAQTDQVAHLYSST